MDRYKLDITPFIYRIFGVPFWRVIDSRALLPFRRHVSSHHNGDDACIAAREMNAEVTNEV